MNTLNKKQKSLIIGCILGDGYITKKTKEGNSYLSIQHSEKQYEYLVYKRNRFIEEGFDVSKIYDVSRKYKAYRFNVKLRLVFNNLRHALYPNGNKTISRHFLNWLDSEGLAIWVMDDGNSAVKFKDNKCVSRWISIATYDFTYQEHIIIQKYMNVVHHLNMKIYKDRKYFRSHFNSTESNKLIPIIKPYFIPSMEYKIDLKYKN